MFSKAADPHKTKVSILIFWFLFSFRNEINKICFTNYSHRSLNVSSLRLGWTHLENTFENTLWLEPPVLGAESASPDLFRLPLPTPPGCTAPPSPVKPSTQVRGYERRFSICGGKKIGKYRISLLLRSPNFRGKQIYIFYKS